jgi:hypothetical protein
LRRDGPNSWTGGHAQAVAADRLVFDLLRKIEHATDEAERIIQEPLRWVRALNAGFRSGFGYLFSRSRAAEHEPTDGERNSSLLFREGLAQGSPWLISSRGDVLVDSDQISDKRPQDAHGPINRT